MSRPMRKKQLPVAEIAEAVSGAVTSVLSNITGPPTGESAVDTDSADEFEERATKRRKKDKGKYVRESY